MKRRKTRKDFSQTALAVVEKSIGGKLVEKAKKGKRGAVKGSPVTR